VIEKTGGVCASIHTMCEAFLHCRQICPSRDLGNQGENENDGRKNAESDEDLAFDTTIHGEGKAV
jgi:hypothetical protein